MSDSDSDKTSTTTELYIDENDNCSVYSSSANKRTKVQTTSHQWHDSEASDSDMEDLKTDDKLLGEGNEENDSLLVIFKKNGSAYRQ